MKNGIEHLHLCLLAFMFIDHLNALCQIPLQISALFSFGFSVLLRCKCSLHILGTIPLLDLHKYLLHFVACIFTLSWYLFVFNFSEV